MASRRTNMETYLCWRSPHAPVHLETLKLIYDSLRTCQPGNEEASYSDCWIWCLGAIKTGGNKHKENTVMDKLFIMHQLSQCQMADAHQPKFYS